MNGKNSYIINVAHGVRTNNAVLKNINAIYSRVLTAEPLT